MKILVNCVSTDIKPYDSILNRVLAHLSTKEGVVVVQNKDITKLSDYTLIVNIGYDYRIISETFKILSKFSKVPKENPQLIFLNPAGETWFKEFNNLVQKAIDEMGCDANVYERIEDFWSLHNFEKFIDFFCRRVDISE